MAGLCHPESTFSPQNYYITLFCLIFQFDRRSSILRSTGSGGQPTRSPPISLHFPGQSHVQLVKNAVSFVFGVADGSESQETAIGQDLLGQNQCFQQQVSAF